MTPERFEDGTPMLLAGVRRRHAFAIAERGIAEQWREFLAAPQIPDRIGSTYYGVMCGSDDTTLEYMCGVKVQSFAALSADAGRMRVPAQRYAVFSHPKDAALAATWQQILQWLSVGPYESAHKPDFEQYSRSPIEISGSGEVLIWVGVVERSASSAVGA